MAQSASDTKKTAKLVNKEQIKNTNPEDVFDCEASKVEAALKELSIDIGKVGPKAKRRMNSTKHCGK